MFVYQNNNNINMSGYKTIKAALNDLADHGVFPSPDMSGTVHNWFKINRFLAFRRRGEVDVVGYLHKVIAKT